MAARARVYLAEAIGTYSLVLAGCGAVMSQERYGVPEHAGVAIAFGLAVAAAVYALGHVSGAHINPAVTLAFAVAGEFPWRRVPGYIAAQSAGSTGAAASLWFAFGAEGSLGVTEPVIGVGRAYALEVMLTALLMLVIMVFAIDRRVPLGMSGVAIGGTVALSALWAGPLSGASMNPARSLGPALVTGDLDSLWVYLSAPVVGALLGAAAYQVVAGRARMPGVGAAFRRAAGRGVLRGDLFPSRRSVAGVVAPPDAGMPVSPGAGLVTRPAGLFTWPVRDGSARSPRESSGSPHGECPMSRPNGRDIDLRDW